MGLTRPLSRYPHRERRISRPSKLVIVLTCLCAGAIAYATLCPIGQRPHLANPDVERFGAFFVLGLFASFAAPRRPMLVLSLLVLLALGLEAAQMLIPTRDARLADACVKATGAVLGAQLGFTSWAFHRWIQRTFGAPPVPAPAPARTRRRHF